MKQGYLYKEGSKLLYLKLKDFNHISGSSLIIRGDLYKLLFIDPNYYDHHLESIDLEPLPFIGGIYSIGNSENIWANSQLISQMNKKPLQQKIQALIRRILKYKIHFFTRSTTEEFGLYNLQSINQD